MSDEVDLAYIPGLVELDLSEATDYGVLVRYDLDFWPERETAAGALEVAEAVFAVVAATLPSGRRPNLPGVPRA